jgi:hypothetical protein
MKDEKIALEGDCGKEIWRDDDGIKELPRHYCAKFVQIRASPPSARTRS